MGKKYDDLRIAVEEKGWQLRSNTYQNLHTLLDLTCPRGHDVQLTYHNWRSNYKCPVCDSLDYVGKDVTPVKKKKGVVRTLAIDPAINITGYAIFDNEELVAYGVHKSSGSNTPIGKRLIENKEWLFNILYNWRPDSVCIEDIQYQKYAGVETFKMLAKLQGIIQAILEEQKLEYEFVYSTVWRKSCEVKGKSRIEKKKSTQFIVNEKYNVNCTEDEADAIGIGLYYSKEQSRRRKGVGTWPL